MGHNYTELTKIQRACLRVERIASMALEYPEAFRAPLIRRGNRRRCATLKAGRWAGLSPTPCRKASHRRCLSRRKRQRLPQRQKRQRKHRKSQRPSLHIHPPPHLDQPIRHRHRHRPPPPPHHHTLHRPKPLKAMKRRPRQAYPRQRHRQGKTFDLKHHRAKKSPPLNHPAKTIAPTPPQTKKRRVKINNCI